RLSKPSPLQVGLQVPCCVRSQTATESDLREYPPSTGTDFPCAGETERMPDRGGSLDAGSCDPPRSGILSVSPAHGKSVPVDGGYSRRSLSVAVWERTQHGTCSPTWSGLGFDK